MGREFWGVHNSVTFKPKHPEKNSNKEKYEILESLVSPKESHANIVKGIQFDEGQKKWDKVDPTDASSTKVVLEYVIILSKIDPEEGRDVAIVDIPGIFLIVSLPPDEIVHPSV